MGTPFFVIWLCWKGGKDMIRYAVIADKNPREIVLLRGKGCVWKRCAFCDYHLDASPDEAANQAINVAALAQVTGRFGRLEVINSGSFPELDSYTIATIKSVCQGKAIHDLHIESHWLYRQAIPALRAEFHHIGVTLHVKTGVETFDVVYREKVLQKGIPETDPAGIAADFDECCLLFGLAGQTAEQMQCDIETGLTYFARVCVNLMTENTTSVRPDPAVCALFRQMIYPRWKDNPRVDILLENTDFGVGGG